MPEIFQGNHSFQLSQEKLDSIEVRHWPFDREIRNSLKSTTENFQKIK